MLLSNYINSNCQRKKFSASSFIFNTLLIYLCFTHLSFPQWVHTNGPFEGVTSSFAKCGNSLFAISPNGLFVSTDNGGSWNLNSFSGSEIKSIAVKDSNIFIAIGATMHHSTDGGKNWNRVEYNGFGAFGKWISAIAVQDSCIIAGNWTGYMFLSTDFGASWSVASNIGLTSVYCFALSGKKLFVGNEYGLLFSTDYGVNWTRVTNGLKNTDKVFRLLVDGTTIYASVLGQGVFISTDNGESWTQSNNGLSSLTINSFAVKDTNIYAGTIDGIFRSTNKGKDWAELSSGLSYKNITAIKESENNLVCGSRRDVYLSTNNGANWNIVKKGFYYSSVQCLSFWGDTLLAGLNSSPGIYTSTNQGDEWIPKSNNLPDRNVMNIAVNGSTLLAGVDLDGVYTSTDNGKNWSLSLGGLLFNSICSYGANVFVGTMGKGVYGTKDKGVTWTVLNNGITDPAKYYSFFVNSIAAEGQNIFAGTQSGVFRSTDSGESWTAVKNGLTDTLITALAVKNSKLFAGTSYGKIFYSTDFGNNWSPAGSSLIKKKIFSFKFYGDNLFAAGYSGIFLSTNFGADWRAINEDNFVETVCIALDKNNLYAGTFSGVWKRPLLDMVPLAVDKSKSKVPSVYILNQNYPNPFNPTTTISFSLPKESFVNLKIFDALGREAATLVNEKLPAGSYTQQWNAEAMPSGVYFYRLQSDGYNLTKKMNLLK